jgi:protein-S-isoprenylcysteine O-methyltransferase Ste14
MFIAIIGASLAIGSWIALGVVLVWGVFLHARVLAEEKTCLAKYGESYRQFMGHVPRYLIV